MTDTHLPADTQDLSEVVSATAKAMSGAGDLMKRAAFRISELEQEKADLEIKLLRAEQLCMRQANEIRRLSK
jgi:hypothetical protein